MFLLLLHKCFKGCIYSLSVVLFLSFLMEGAQKPRRFSEKRVRCVIGLSQKKSKQGGGQRGRWIEDIRFSKRPLELLDLWLYPWIYQIKWRLIPGNSTKLCYTRLSFQGQKPRPMDIPHNIFLITYGNSISSTPLVWFFSGVVNCYLEGGFAKVWFWDEMITINFRQ